MTSFKRLGLLAAFLSLGAASLANSQSQQIKIDRAINSPTLAVKYTGVRAALIELRINGESMGTRTVSEAVNNGETTFSINVLSLKDGDNQVEIRLYDKKGNVVGSEKTVITTDSDTRGPVFLSTPKVGENAVGPCEITVGFGREFKNSYVSFFVDNQFKSMTNFPPYTYTWDTTRETNGWHEVEAWVVDETSSTFKTRKVRVFVNNPGGRTYRPTAAASKPAPAKATPIKVAPTKTTKTTKAQPLPDPRLGLKTADNQIGSPAGLEAPLKAINPAVSSASSAKTIAMAPAIAGIISDNPVATKLEGNTLGAKPTAMPGSTSVGPRLLMPTGKRTIPTTAKTDNLAANSVAAKVDGEAKATKSTIEATSQPSPADSNAMVPKSNKPNASEDDPGSVVALVPTSTTEAAVTTYHPVKKMDVTGEAMPRPMPNATEPAAPAIASAKKPTASNPMTSMASTDSVMKTTKMYPNTPGSAKELAKRLLPVNYGTRLPVKSTYTIEYKGSPVVFDVAPMIHQGVPVTPFRHLIEKSGGQIDWKAEEHEVVAIADGRDIWLKIGDRYAKIDSLAVKLELAPFIERGRTIVPLSFIRTALNVNVDYDKATGHVLITPKDK